MIMKKKYIAPALEAFPVEVQQIIALSLIKDGKANDRDALVKENDWDIFGEYEEDDTDADY